MDDKIKAAYALNLWTVSVAQIIDYNDVYILEQEYDNIMNNLNLEHMPKDEALLEISKRFLIRLHIFEWMKVTRLCWKSITSIS